MAHSSKLVTIVLLSSLVVIFGTKRVAARPMPQHAGLITPQPAVLTSGSGTAESNPANHVKTALKPAKNRTQSPDMLTYQQWKSNRVLEAKAVLNQLNEEIKVAVHHHQDHTKLDRLKHRAAQAAHNFDVARDLSAHDYFVAYVTENFPNNPKALTFMVKHMAPADTAEILVQYQHTLNQSQVFNSLSPSSKVSSRSSSAPTAGLSYTRPTVEDFGGRLQEVKSMTVYNRMDDDPIHDAAEAHSSPHAP